jgi:hypothetical protein
MRKFVIFYLNIGTVMLKNAHGAEEFSLMARVEILRFALNDKGSRHSEPLRSLQR